MKHLSTALLFAFAFLFIHATYANTLKESETTKIFNQINTDKDTTLEGEEIEKAFTAAATKLFEKAKFHKDEDLISALAKQYAKESKSKLTKEEFKSSIDKLFKFAKNFREEAYTEVLKKLEMNEVLNDPDLLKEVISKPEVYGLTYGSSNEVFDELEKVYKETADTIKEIQAQFEELLSKKEESHESVGDKVTFRQLGEVKEGVHKVQEGAQEVGHKVQEGVHAGVHRVQEGVQETVNTVKEKVEEVKHKVEEAKDKAETKAEATADSVKGTVQGNNAAQDAVNKAKETVEDVKNTAQAAGHRVEETVHAAGHTVQEGVQHVGNKIDETVEQVKHRVEETGTKAGNRADEAKDRLQENAQKTVESVKEKAHDAADAVKEGLHLQREKTLTEKLTEAAGTIFDDHVNPMLHKIGAALGLHKKDEGVKGKVEDAVQHAKDKVKEGVDKVKDKLSGDDEEL